MDLFISSILSIPLVSLLKIFRVMLLNNISSFEEIKNNHLKKNEEQYNKHTGSCGIGDDRRSVSAATVSFFVSLLYYSLIIK